MAAIFRKNGPVLRRLSHAMRRIDGFQLTVALVMLALSAFMLLPIVYIFNHTFKPYHELFVYPPTIWAKDPSLQNIKELVLISSNTVVPLSRYLFNSLFIAGAAVALVTGISALCAYPISKHQFPGHRIIFSLIILTLMFAPEVVQIPRYLVVSKLGLINTYFGHILPLVAMPVGVFLLKQFIDQIPNELLEAARIDGGGELILLTRIVMPVCMPAVATVAILAFQNSWGNIETSALFMQDDEMKNFAYFLSTLTNNLANTVARQGAAAAAALVMFVPNLIIFLFLQGKMIATMAHSGIK